MQGHQQKSDSLNDKKRKINKEETYLVILVASKRCARLATQNPLDQALLERIDSGVV